MFKLLQNKLALYLFGGLLILIIGLGILTSVLLSKVDMLRYEKERWRSNYATQTLQTWQWKAKTGEVVSSAVAERLQAKEIEKSQDAKIKKLNEYAGKLDIKVKKLEYMASIQVSGHVDTVLKPDFIYIPGSTQYKEIDSLNLGPNSYIYRIFNSQDSTAKYKIHIGGSLYMYYEGMKKQGKWKLKNLFTPREKLPVVSIVSDNKLIEIGGIKIVNVEPKKWFGWFTRN